MRKSLQRAALLLLTGWAAFAQGRESGDASRGVTWNERFEGSVNTLGAVNQLDTTVGYKFNSHFSVDGGIPVYFVRPSSSATAATGTSSSNGIGNVYAQLRLTLANPAVNFASTLTGTAPTGDRATGFSTGHATVDWSNYFDRSFSRLTPFANLGIANSVSDTMFFIRPYTTYGLVTHVEGGARYRLVRMLSVGASAYGIEPSGQQTVVSRIVKSKQGGSVNSGGSKGGVFETANVTTGSADIAKDHGFSTWAQIQPGGSIEVYAGYSRSTQYALDTIFFGISLNLGKAVRSLGI
ncbi:MAG: hypothetical protein LAP40_22790 [Acidobacteriia bacterium]|nr:hypothetical protein [Terriglobia bacterium]